ncbi:multi-sensor hybrid histidine kinase [Planomonospora sphaerica]|uniref:histidine kinase n=1 Tax=Planomonospora sphaerica TaxID=161355 RepID=A0A171B069_9ACTN|nr:ATP-binding protein [Planomonospora sphaerica]GAT64519.1 multi-sensor hybrid histidine kinase [Planomonospora sphaerica]
MCSALPASPAAGDARRLEALRAAGLLDAPEVPSLTRLADLAAALLDVPAVLVALAAAEEQVVLGAAGPAARPGTRRAPLRDSLCGRVVARGAPLVVPDVRDDARTGGRWRGDPALPGLEAGSCAGFPLRAPDGEVLGALGVIGAGPRRWPAAQLDTAGDIAAMAEAEIASRLAGGEALLAERRLRTVLDRARDAFVFEDAVDAADAVDAEGAEGAATDGTAGEELERERTFLAALLDSLEAGVVACDADGRVALFNRALRAVLRASEQPVDAREWAGTYHLTAPDGRTPLRPEEVPLARAFAGERVEGAQVVVSTPGLPPRRFLVNGRPIDASDGSRLGAVAVMHDITGRHRTEVLRDVQRAVAEALADASSGEEAAGRVVAAVARGLGWACGEYWHAAGDGGAIVRTASWTAPGWDLSEFTGDERVVFRSGVGLPGLVWATGREVWVRDLPSDPLGFARREAAARAGLHAAVGLPVGSGREPLGVLAFFAETVEEPDGELVALLDGVRAHLGHHLERRRAEELALALEAGRRHLDRIIGQVDDYVWTLEILPGGAFHAVYTSPDAGGVFGGRPAEGADVLESALPRVHPEDRVAVDAYLRTLASGEAAETVFRFRGLDDVTRWLWCRGRPRREDGRLFVDGISSDVTEHYRLEEERERLLEEEQRRVERLEDLDRMKDELVAVVSHELRSPIGAIRGYTEMLLDDPGLAGERRSFAEVIDRRSEHLQRLVDDLLDLARFDAGRVGVDLRPVSLSGLVRDAVGDQRPAAAVKRLTVTADAPGRLPVRADPVRLRQVLDNLLSNAVRYTPVGGSVAVTARCEGAEAVIAVADTGIGIPAEEYPRLFDRFFRASTARRAGITGTGLGLAVTKAVVEAHGGTVTAAPGGGGGTVFTVRLPTGGPAPES